LPEQWNQGYGTETARALIKFGFEKLSLHKIEAGVATENIRSINVLEKAGMIREGLRRKILPIRGNGKTIIIMRLWKMIREMFPLVIPVLPVNATIQQLHASNIEK